MLNKCFYIALLMLLKVIFSPVYAVSLPDENSSGIIDELQVEYGRYKNIPQEYQLAVLIALSGYPELKDAAIDFEYKGIKTTMLARPQLKCLILPKRSYLIRINSEAGKRGSVSFDDLDLNAKIGIVAHELAHISKYEEQSIAGLIISGILYKTIPVYKKKLERETDRRTIDRGFGSQLYVFSDYVLNHSNASDSYKVFKQKYYFSPEEIIFFNNPGKQSR